MAVEQPNFNGDFDEVLHAQATQPQRASVRVRGGEAQIPARAGAFRSRAAPAFASAARAWLHRQDRRASSRGGGFGHRRFTEEAAHETAEPQEAGAERQAQAPPMLRLDAATSQGTPAAVAFACSEAWLATPGEAREAALWLP